MKKTIPALAALGLLVACGGSGTNPFTKDQSGTTTTTGPLPGTTNATTTSAIQRYEEESTSGSGYAKNISYNANTNEFTVDNLVFDGDNVYAASRTLPNIGPFQVYEADVTSTALNGTSVQNTPYAAIYGKSRTGGTEFAIVRSGGYQNYGFGGFLYQRNATRTDGSSAGVVLPTSGRGAYSGAYAGTKIFKGKTGQEFTRGDATVDIDFDDFNDGKLGVFLRVHNRRLFNAQGQDITNDYLAALARKNTDPAFVPTTSGGVPVLPDITAAIDPSAHKGNGELSGEVTSIVNLNNGTSSTLDTGKYYAIMSGPQADEIVGVIVMEGKDPRTDGVSAQETGGFIVYTN